MHNAATDTGLRGNAGALIAEEKSNGYTHYNFGQGPDLARVIAAHLDQPPSSATQFTP